MTAGSEKRNPRAKRHSGQRERKDSARTGDTSFAWRHSSCFLINDDDDVISDQFEQQIGKQPGGYGGEAGEKI